MKTTCRLILCAIGVLLMTASCSQYTVYSVRSKPGHRVSGGMLYALPHTQIRVAVTFDKHDYASAPYAAFAKDMLGVEPPAADSLYSIRTIEVSTVNVADPDEYYYVVPRRTPVEIDSRGLLLSVGCAPSKPKSSAPDDAQAQPLRRQRVSAMPEYNLYDRADTFYTRHDAPGKPSLVTTGKDVRSLKQRAQVAAEHIEDIREKKEALLFGEYEGNLTPDAIQYIYNQLDGMEKNYLKEFLGEVQTETVVFYVDPKDEKTLVDNQTVELFRFNPATGITDSNDHKALVVSCNIRCENELRNAARFVKYRTRSVGSGDYGDRHSFKYRVPETATVTVFSDLFSFEKRVKVAQFGYISNLPFGRCKARFNPITSELMQFEP